MYTTFYGMACNPFLKNESIKYKFESADFRQTINRFDYLKEIKGIGLFVGEPGLGKTYTIRYFINSLNKDLYKVIYISANKNMTSFDFLKILSDKLDLDIGACYKMDVYNNIQKEIRRLVLKERIQPLVIIDDAHNLSREILFDLKVLYDFEMDAYDYVATYLVGETELKEELTKVTYQTLKQRILVNYTFQGMTREEIKGYIESRLEISNTNKNIFEINAINALYSCCRGIPRRLNTLVINCLMLGCQEKKTIIDEEIVMNAKVEIDLN